MKKLALVSMIGLVLTGCGGGGSDDNGGQTQPQAKAVMGTIESVQSNNIWVNGDRYTVSSVGYGNLNDVMAPTALAPNMMVKLVGHARAGVEVQLEPTMIGVVSEVSGTSFKVNGVALTFDGLKGIENGDWVLVSSLPTATEGYKVLSVVKIEADKFDNTVEIEGPVSNLDENTTTFKLGAALTVNYNTAKMDLDSALANDLWVEVTGKMNDATNELDATEVEADDYDDLGNEAEVEGIITAVNHSESYFEVNYRGRFNFDHSTEVELANDRDGSIADIKLGLQVEVESVLRNGQRFATDVEFDNYAGNQWQTFEQEGQATEGTEAGSFKLNGMTVYTDSKTRYEDGLTFNSLTQGLIEVDGVVINGKNVAREIERED
ncbi:DUF5666 domain-containing protein [Photobacterium aphoticum]|uniref:DUF5666 domain-containing protein n=1 Tax=Photobacterium aphoticum TaxID=754436 RepID=A0A0J1GLC0_9GAMM|nr:DUF5666 domain-containing protein [Photobacterium aphoticum]KLV00229.1 hypothetical protein ABT58_14715 [Photobacterium aphoticum]PSU56598.1 hypothetical protein C9I90_12420 [Photobacterium aphoticum]GHA55905.1 hypothetical protein GCM10007086_32390 [Photobacterium aphoticum]